jgi:SAM-dependent methyltransferase
MFYMRTRDLGQSFGSEHIDALRYDTFRPVYPEELIDDLVVISGIKTGETILEIGAGTGIATRPLADRGFSITAIEPSGHMIDVAQTNMPSSHYPSVKFVQQTFLDYFERSKGTSPDSKIVAAFTAFHWLEPVNRLGQSRELLANGGVLAVGLSNHLTGGESDPLHQATMPIIESFVEQPVDDGDPNTVSVIYDGHTAADIKAPLKESELEQGQFEIVQFKKYDAQIVHTAAEYIGLMSTFSAIKALTRADQAALFKALYTTVKEELGNEANVKFAPSMGIYRPMPAA